MTTSLSRTRTSLTMPPVGCCTFFTFESTTTEPGAIRAPEIGTLEAQPTPLPANTRTTTRPTIRSFLIDWCVFRG
ncbi:hypothetical protein GCM10007857_64380 [Bradyrhizobium iriomotense]|uniref:Uncharacterized protein n=1 Tax=Bradyrhizobium iriomotense TaxID=441950 RepID=A0ABQ6B5L7_9BRAD|nr:hypothetical protein GCM10007857_64380 [Bradyrhizobium iriomotense]